MLGRATLLVMVPESDVEESVPIVVGEVKEPVELDNCAVNTFPEVKVPVAVYGMPIPVFPAQKGLPEMVPVARVFVTEGVQTSEILEN